MGVRLESRPDTRLATMASKTMWDWYSGTGLTRWLALAVAALLFIFSTAACGSSEPTSSVVPTATTLPAEGETAIEEELPTAEAPAEDDE